MHELSLIAELFDILKEKAEDEQAAKVTFVKLRVGMMSGVVPELLKTAFHAYKKGTLASKARLQVEVVPLKIRCRACGGESTAKHPVFACSACASQDFEIIEGQELSLEKMEIEKEDML